MRIRTCVVKVIGVENDLIYIDLMEVVNVGDYVLVEVGHLRKILPGIVTNIDNYNDVDWWNNKKLNPVLQIIDKAIYVDFDCYCSVNLLDNELLYGQFLAEGNLDYDAYEWACNQTVSSKDYETLDFAIKTLEKSVLKGISAAAYYLGNIYEAGKIVEKDLDMANEYFIIGKEQFNDVYCKLKLIDAKKYKTNIVFELYSELYNQIDDASGDLDIKPFVDMRVARCYIEGIGVETNYLKATELLGDSIYAFLEMINTNNNIFQLVENAKRDIKIAFKMLESIIDKVN